MYSRTFNTLAVSVGFALVLAGCGGADPDVVDDDGVGIGTVPATAAPAPDAASNTDMVTVADIVGDPMRYVGQTVTVEADVEEVLTPYAFQLDEDAITEGGIDNDLTVFSPKSAQLEDIDDQWLNNKVRVTGKVQAYNVVDVERDIGWDLDPEIETELEGVKAVIIATSVTRVDSM